MNDSDTNKIMDRFIHRIVSARTRGIVPRERLYNEISSHKKLIWLGEIHSEHRIAAFQDELLASLAQQHSRNNPPTRLHVVMEHFSFEMQDMLDSFQSDPSFGFDQLKSVYKEIGTEGHDLDYFKNFLLFCKEKQQSQEEESICEIRLHGGFLPRPLASRLNKAENKEEKTQLFEELFEKDFLPAPSNPLHSTVFADKDQLLLQGSQSHFRLIQSMMSGQDLYIPTDQIVEKESIGSSTPIERLYQAQLLKDHAMGYQLCKLMTNYQKDRFLVVAGLGHLKHYLGVPECLERYLKVQALQASDLSDREVAMNALLSVNSSSSLIGCQMMYETYLEEKYPPLQEAMELPNEAEQEKAKHLALQELALQQPNLLDQYIPESNVINGPMMEPSAGMGRFEKPSFDYCLVYDEDDDNVLPLAKPQSKEEAAKTETALAYNQVGSTAGNRGNLIKATAVMSQLQYSNQDMELIGDNDLYNFQGVANPHRVSNIQPGERVLDIGSGLGVDSFLAAAHGASRVLGVDLAANQVAHATARAQDRGIAEQATFVQGDVEQLDIVLKQNGLQNETFDVCISNGAFCLIPDKKKAFQQVYNALRPGGRMAISTTTIMANQKLQGDHEWPVCMRMFANLDDIEPMCQEIGFEKIELVDAESPMEGMEIPEEALDHDQTQDGQKRFKIHGKYTDQYKYLEDLNMDELCKVITVYGVKPANTI